MKIFGMTIVQLLVAIGIGLILSVVTVYSEMPRPVETPVVVITPVPTPPPVVITQAPAPVQPAVQNTNNLDVDEQALFDLIVVTMNIVPLLMLTAGVATIFAILFSRMNRGGFIFPFVVMSFVLFWWIGWI